MKTTARPILVGILLSLGLAGCGQASPATGSLQVPPDLQVGDWWAVEVDPTLVGVPIPTTLVVTGRDADRVTIGIPPEEFHHDFLVLHVPPLGDLDPATLGWHVMWADFEPLRFPLETGRSWEADFHGHEVAAEVASAEGSRARVTLAGPGNRIELVYDADVGMITEFREDRLQLNFRVVEHGSGYEGPVLSPTGIRLALMEPGPPSPRDPATGEGGTLTTEVEVASGSSHGSLSLVLWNAGAEDDPGRYRITVTAPDGTVFEEVFETEAGSPSVIPSSFGHDVVDGTWHIDFERDGPGRLLVELFTYDLEERVLGGGAGPAG